MVSAAPLAVLFLLATTVVAVDNSTVSGKDCGPGGKPAGGCCTCEEGWTKDTAGRCTECAEGYFGSKYGVCVNGRPGSVCLQNHGTALPFPLACGTGGTCSTDKYNRFVFPCNKCGNGNTPASGCTIPAKSSCLPRGPALYTPMPNRPVAGKPFNLILVGCLDQNDLDVAVIPAYKNNEMRNPATCGDIAVDKFAPQCQFNGTGIKPSKECTEGVLVSGAANSFGAWEYDDSKASYVRLGLKDLTFTKDFSQQFERPQEFQADKWSSNFLVCTKQKKYDSTGTEVGTWVAVPGMDDMVEKRDHVFAVDAVQSNRGSAGLDGIMDNGCCDGLKLGDGCLPLWAFILLWLLMLGCLAGLAYMMRKHNAELEQNKNNQKYEQFCADAEMMDLADDRDDDEDL